MINLVGENRFSLPATKAAEADDEAVSSVLRQPQPCEKAICELREPTGAWSWGPVPMVGTEPPCSGRQTLEPASSVRGTQEPTAARVPADADARPAPSGMSAWSLRAGRARHMDSATGGSLSDVQHTSAPSLLLASAPETKHSRLRSTGTELLCVAGTGAGTRVRTPQVQVQRTQTPPSWNSAE